MNVTYDSSLSNRQKQWFQEGVSLNEYPDWDSIEVDITVEVVTEPPCAGHKDTMCTTLDGAGNGVVYIRQGFDDPNSPINSWENGTLEEAKRFYLETVSHELGHVISLTILNTDELKSTAAALFTRHGAEGEGYAAGTLDDWNPLDAAHGDRIQEAIAEVLKDAYLADNVRLLENNSNWDISAQDFITLMTMLLPPVILSHGGGGWHSDDVFPPPSLDYVLNNNPTDAGGSAWFGATPELRGVGAPPTAQFGMPVSPAFDMSGSDCMAFGITGADYAQMIECPTGHAAPDFVGTWGDPYIGGLTHPLAGGWGSVSLGLEAQGFAPVDGTWHWGGPFPNLPNDSSKDYYIYIFSYRSCSGADTEHPGETTTMAYPPTTYPVIGGDLYPSDDVTGPPPPPPPYPYEPETVSGSQGDGQTMRFG